jgi:hypothetical protein
MRFDVPWQELQAPLVIAACIALRAPLAPATST